MMGYKEYTTLFEGWGAGVDGFGGGTINHAWSGGPLTILSQKLCGVEPTSPAFKTFRVAPQMGTLTDASATVPSIYGDIKVAISQKGKAMSIHVDVPDGTTAEVIFPNGKQVKLAPGTHLIKGHTR